MERQTEDGYLPVNPEAPDENEHTHHDCCAYTMIPQEESIGKSMRD